MKKYISVFTIMVMIFLAACSNQNTSSTPTSNENNTQSNSVTKLDEGVWPANEYTEGLPVAPGTVAYTFTADQWENIAQESEIGYDKDGRIGVTEMTDGEDILQTPAMTLPKGHYKVTLDYRYVPSVWEGGGGAPLLRVFCFV